MKQNMSCPNMDYVDLMAQRIYQTAFPNSTFEEIEKEKDIKIELNKKNLK